MSGFRLDWQAGASAQIELFSPKAGGTYSLKYTPAYRSTLRPPVEDSPLSPAELAPIQSGMETLFTTLRGLPRGGEAAPGDANGVVQRMETLGNQLEMLVLPPYVQADLRVEGLHVELGLDEALVAFPWEIMHDGESFLSLKHAVGRFVNTSRPSAMRQSPVGRFSGGKKNLSVLLVSIPNPLPRPNGTTYEALPEAEAETAALVDFLSAQEGVTLATLIGRDAKYDDVFNALQEREYDILHFNGHATFDREKPRMSGLVLSDRDMTTGAVARFVGRRPPTLCFVNACETARVQPAGGGEPSGRYDVFDLARAFLDTESYLLGSRWRIADETAREFAKSFYAALVRDGRSIGEATLEARKHCRASVPADPYGWASYILYGDPRMCFRREDE